MRLKSGLKSPSPRIVNRRRFLTALGLGALAAGASGAPRSARAQSTAKNRILLWLTDHGTVPESWSMDLGFSGSGTQVKAITPSSDFSPILSPLAPHAAKLNILEGIGRAPEIDYERRGGEGDRHTFGQTMVLTCVDSVTQSDIMGGGPSIDQVIGEHAAVPGRWGARAYGRNHFKGYSFQDRGRPTPLVSSPGTAFDDLMGLYVPGEDPGEMQPETPTREQLIRRARASVLDFAAGEYDLVSARLSGEDRLKLEEHRQLVRDLELTFQGQGGGGNPMPTAACDPETYDDSGADIDLFGRIAALAFSCDMTRVVLMINRLPSGDFDMPSGKDFHQDIAHGANSDPEAARVMTDFNTAYARHFAELVGHLDGISDGDGKTLLDNTITTWLTELATGPHDLNDVPYVIAGSGAGYLKTGQYVRFGRENRVEGGWDQYSIGPSNGNLYVTLMQSMGMTDETFGVSEVQGMSIRGVLPEILA
ncbi:MAG TPA: DUF1552 domain-containing protein [Polyangiaceae bacterium]